MQAVALVAEAYLPATQCRQPVAATAAALVPTAHEEQLVADSVEYLPDGQFMHFATTETAIPLEYVPDGQLVQLDDPVLDW